MKSGGKGGAGTTTGAAFERKIRTDVMSEIPSSNYFYLKGQDIFWKGNNQYYGTILIEGQLFKFYDSVASDGLTGKDILSHTYRPDFSIITPNTLFVAEFKFQNTSGSTVEKMLNIEARQNKFEVLFRRIGITNYSFCYVINDYIANNFKEDLDYMVNSYGISVFVNKLPAHFFGIR